MDKKIKISLIFLLLLQLGLIIGYIYYENYHWKGRKLRVVECLESPLSFFSPYGKGFDYDLVLYLAQKENLDVVWKRVNSLEKGINLLKKAEVDLVVGVPNVVKVDLDYVKRGEDYIKNNFLFIHNKRRYPLRRFDELCLAQVLVPQNSIFISKITEYDKVIFCPINYKVVNKKTEEVFEILEDNKARFMLTDKIKFNTLNPYFLDLRPTYEFKQHFFHNWWWSPRYEKLDKILSSFWSSDELKSKLKELEELYLGFFPEDIDFYQLNHLQEVILEILPRYEKDILRACNKFNLDPLLFIAQIYQESSFNPKAKSRTGVRGLLQLSSNTASMLGVKNRLNPSQSIWGGAKYMAFLEERVSKKGVQGWDKWFFVLAAYNQGLGHLYDAMDLAQKQGKNPFSWRAIKEIYPLLSYRKFYKGTKYGYCRGYEAVDYVQSIRYYYYVLNLLVFLGGREGDYLRSFVSVKPGIWPR